MKILIISGSYPPIRCGVGDYVAHLAPELLQQGHTVKVVTGSKAAPAEGISPLVPVWSFAAWKPLKKTVREFEPDIIHLQYPTAPYGRRLFINLIGLMLRLNFPQIKRLITVHEYHDASLLGRLRTRLTLFGFQAIITTNEASKARLSRWTRKPITRIPIGSNIKLSPTSATELKKTRERYSNGRPHLLTYFGFIDRSKGVSELVEAVGRLKDDVQLVVATDFDSNNHYHRELMDEIKRSNNITWTGFLPDDEISRLLQVSDILVLPFAQPASLRRGSLVAGLAHSNAIITTGPAEPPLAHKHNCWATQNNSPDSLATAIHSLLADPTLRKMLGVAAGRLAQDFDWGNIATRHLKLYADILD